MIESDLPPEIQEQIERLKDIGFGYVLAIGAGTLGEPENIIVQPFKVKAADSPEKQAPETATTRGDRADPALTPALGGIVSP